MIGDERLGGGDPAIAGADDLVDARNGGRPEGQRGDRVRPADGVLFATPEYNRSVPGCLKNAIDVGSRPYGKSVWSGKPAAVISVSPGAISSTVTSEKSATTSGCI